MNSLKLPVFLSILCLAVCGPLMFLQHGLAVDVVVSPAWQVALYYGLLIPFGMIWYVASIFVFFPRGRGWLWAVFGLMVSQLALVSAVGWWLEGPELGFRNSRVEDLVALFAGLSPFTVILLRLGRLRFFRGLLEGLQGEFSS